MAGQNNSTDRGFRQCPECLQFVWIDAQGSVAPHEVWEPGAEMATICNGGRLTPEAWQERTGVKVLVRNGWTGAFGDVTWDMPIDRDEFLRRAMVSECEPWPRPLLDEVPAGPARLRPV